MGQFLVQFISLGGSILSATQQSVFYDAETNKHRLDVEFSEEVSGLLEFVSNDAEGLTVKKSGSSVGDITAEQDYSVTVE